VIRREVLPKAVGDEVGISIDRTVRHAPDGVAAVSTKLVDVDEVEVVAWTRGKESWSVDYQAIEGDTARAEVWAKLNALLERHWPPSGHMLPTG
jgi:phage terminase large subunit GpA-like protein